METTGLWLALLGQMPGVNREPPAYSHIAKPQGRALWVSKQGCILCVPRAPHSTHLISNPPQSTLPVGGQRD